MSVTEMLLWTQGVGQRCRAGPCIGSRGCFYRPSTSRPPIGTRFAVSRKPRTGTTRLPGDLKSIELDSAALANFMVDLQSCEARFPDGTHLSIPKDATVAPVPLREALATAASTIVYLAVPPLRLGQSNADKDSVGARSPLLDSGGRLPRRERVGGRADRVPPPQGPPLARKG